MIYGLLKIIIMEALEKESLSGYDLMNLLGNQIGKKPSSGSVYPILKDLNRKKLISLKEDGRRKVYSLTKEGRLIIEGILKNRKEISERVENIHGIISGFSKEKFPAVNDKLCKEMPEFKVFFAKSMILMHSNDNIKKERFKLFMKRMIAEMPK
jgi:DNA-binding PadR family transcriptional regulator